MPVEPSALERALRGLQHLETVEVVPSALQEIVDAAAALFDGEGAGLLLLDQSQALRYVASTDERAEILEHMQEQLGQGPCVDALILDVTVAAADIGAEPRWHELAEVVIPKGVRAVLGVPVHIAGAAVGSLDIYRSEPHEWDDSERESVVAFTRMVENVLGAAVAAHRRGELIEQLEYALQHRVTIERAVGVIMAQRSLDAVSAFNHLRTMSRNSRRRTADVAAEILSGIAPSPADAS